MVKFVGGVVVVKVGVVIEIELKECKLCIEDVFNFICVVVEEGIVVGGGIVFVSIYNKVVVLEVEGDVEIGINIVFCFLEELVC